MPSVATEDPMDSSVLAEYSNIIDLTTFEQILEMDDDDDREFSSGIVYDFFDQAKATFKRMQECLAEKELKQISELGHFLKGSSATLGMIKVKESCEKIQHYGAMKDATGNTDEPDKKLCLQRCDETIAQAKDEFDEAKLVLEQFYGREAE